MSIADGPELRPLRRTTLQPAPGYSCRVIIRQNVTSSRLLDDQIGVPDADSIIAVVYVITTVGGLEP